MPKKKTPEDKPDEQFKRFVETAREHGVDETESKVELEFDRLSKQGKSKRNAIPK